MRVRLHDESVSSFPYSGGGVAFLADLVRANYFYFLSAALMMLGSYLLMHSELITGDVFEHTLKTLLVLQAYELLVIVTAVVIARHFRVLGDAASLLTIELLLLLDPTFFGNSFFTMLRTQAAAVNAICLVAVLVKLGVLAWGLRFRLSLGGLAGFLLAALYVYVFEGRLIFDRPLPGVSREIFHYLLAWAPLLAIVLMPPRPLRFDLTRPGYADLALRRRLSLLFKVIVIAIFVAHLIESALVYVLPFFPYLLSPLALVGAVALVKRRAVPQRQVGALLLGVDALGLLALFLSSKLPRLMDIGPAQIAPPEPGVLSLIHSPVPIVACGLALGAIYLAFYVRHQYRPALWRIVAMALVAGVLGLALQPAVREAGAFTWNGLIGSVSAIGLVVGRRLLPVVRFVAAGWREWAGLACVAVLVRDYLSGARLSGGRRVALAFIAALCSLLRFCPNPATWSGLIVAIEIAFFVAAGLRRGYDGYLKIGLIQGLVFLIAGATQENWYSRSLLAALQFANAHPYPVCWGIWAGLLGLAIWLRRSWLWIIFGTLSIILAAFLLPGRPDDWTAEVFEAWFALLLGADHASRNDDASTRGGRYVLATLVVAIGLARFLSVPALWSGGVVVAECAALLAMASMLNHRGYFTIAGVQGAAFIWISWSIAKAQVSAPVAVVAGALALFAVGVVVTFNKERLLGWLEGLAEPPATALPADGPLPMEPQIASDQTMDADVDVRPTKPPADSGAEPAAAPSNPHPEPKLDRTDAVRRYVRDYVGAPEPPEIALIGELSPPLRALLDTSVAWDDEEWNVVYLMRGRWDARRWRVLPCWICEALPEEEDSDADQRPSSGQR